MKPCYHFLLLISMGIFFQCSKKEQPAPVRQPRAGFSFVITTNGTLPCKVNFTNTSANTDSYRWDFGDGQTETVANPEHLYQQPGSFTVKLVATGPAGSDSTMQLIKIEQNLPKADFSYTISTEGVLPCSVQFSNLSQQGQQYKWYFGDGDSATQSNPVKQYHSSQTFTVKLVVSNTAGKDSISKKITIGPLLYSVKVLLITPKNTRWNRQYYQALNSCVQNLLGWYKQQMGGKTFVLNTPVVDTVTGLHDSAWYNSNNGTISGNDPRFYGYYNTYYEMTQLLGDQFNNGKYVYMVYVAAPGGGAGASGFCALGDQDLKGLTGLDPDPVSRWIGGAGHELGHAFGLPHPDNQNPAALMWTGYTIYPSCLLQQADKDLLNKSPFFK
jgi:PKD repeat protein